MQLTIALGLEELRSLPLELRQKIHQALDLPVAQPPQQQYVPVPAPMPQLTYAQPQAPVYSQPMPPEPVPQLPFKAPVVQNGVPTFMADRSHVNAQSVAMDVLTGQTFAIPGPPAGPVVPQVDNAPAMVTAVQMSGPVNPAPMAPVQQVAPVQGVTVDQVRAETIRMFNSSPEGKARAMAAQHAAGVPLGQLSPENCGLLAAQLRLQGAPI